MEWKKQKETESKFPGCLDINKQFLQEKTLEGKITNGFNCILFRPSSNSHVAHCCTLLHSIQTTQTIFALMIASNNYTLWAKTEVRTDHFLCCLLLLLGRWAKRSDQTDIVSQILAVSLMNERSIRLQDVPSNRCCFMLVIWSLI